MILAVTLVRDSVPNVDRFVTENLGGGVDHLVVVLDGAQPEVERHLADREGVTTVVADDAWWGGERVETLNGRQRVAANLVRVACAGLGWVDWLFFLDGDEVALLDREVLAAVPTGTDVVRLRPLESVSQPPGAPVRWFKRLLEREELRRLRRLGVLEKANNARYFHGHVSGKVGVRPAADLWLGVHAAEDGTGRKAAELEHPDLRHLHYESPSREEFVRKWTALAASGPPPGMRERRAAVLRAFVELADEPDPARRAAVHAELFAAHAADDVDALLAAGVLVAVDATTFAQAPRPLGSARLAELEGALARAAARPKRSFLPPRPTAD